MSSFKKCGISVAADESEDFEINLEGVVNFMVDENDTLSDTEYHFHVRVAYCYINTLLLPWATAKQRKKPCKLLYHRHCLYCGNLVHNLFLPGV